MRPVPTLLCSARCALGPFCVVQFCWTLFKLLDTIGVPYHVVNIDSFEFAKEIQQNMVEDEEYIKVSGMGGIPEG